MSDIVKRLLYAIPSILFVLFVTFYLARIVPSDPARMIAGEQAPEATLEKIRAEMGLDKPIPVQFALYLQQVSTGDFGTSLQTGQKVLHDFTLRLPASIELATVSMSIAVLLGVPLGILSAVKKNSLIDGFSRLFTLLGTSIPIFWFGFMMIYFLYSKWNVFPAPMGRIEKIVQLPTHVTGFYILDSLLSGDMVALKSSLRQIAMPAICLSLSSMAVISRMTRANMIDILPMDYMKTARAKGVPRFKIIGVHGFLNILVPVLTVIGMQFGALIGNAVITETIFAWPGIGEYVTKSILLSDYAPVQAFVVFSVVLYILINLILDMLYKVVDPRIQ